MSKFLASSKPILLITLTESQQKNVTYEETFPIENTTKQKTSTTSARLEQKNKRSEKKFKHQKRQTAKTNLCLFLQHPTVIKKTYELHG